MQSKNIMMWILRLIPAIIMIQTLYFKFTGAPESIYIFETVGLEPMGRYGSGVAELIAAVMLLTPMLTVYGALLGCGVISGALFFHLTKLGIEIMGDGGTLFYLALITFVCCAILVFIERDKLLKLIGK